LFSVRNGITFILIGGVIMLFDFGFRGSMEAEAWLQYDLGFVRFSAWIAGAVIAGLGLIFLIGGILRPKKRYVR
jgi:hypothetical protein